MIKVIIASYQRELRSLVKNGVTDRDIYVYEVYNLVEAASILNPNELNILIFDLDSGLNPERYMKSLMQKFNLKVILTGSNSKKAFSLYQIGVYDFIIKPLDYESNDAVEYVVSITQRIRDMKKSNINSNSNYKINWAKTTSLGINTNMKRINTVNSQVFKDNPKRQTLIAIASSTGGVEALHEVLTKLPEDMPPIVVVQHMPKLFVRQFAQRLDKFCKLNVKEGENNEIIKRGCVYIAPGDIHTILVRRGDNLAIQNKMGEKLHGVRPSADVLFNSVADVMHENALGVILTGMGGDGARGLYAMKLNGAKTIGQNKETCVVYGMPMIAKNIGAVDEELPLYEIPNKIIQISKKL